MALIISASALGDERRDHTLSFIVLRPIPRSAIAGAKLAAALVVAAGVNAIGAAAIAVVFGLETGTWGVALPLILGSIVATVVYGSVFVPLGFFTERAVLIGLAYVFIFENAVVSALSGLSALSPWRIGVAVFSGLSPDWVAPELGNFGAANLAGAGAAALTTLVVAMASLAALTSVLYRRDLA